jgi:hypothetical protein
VKTRLREMTPADIPAVQRRLKEQNNRDGTSYSIPRIFDERGQRLRNIPLALVAVSIETGEVVQGHVWENTVEQTCYGTDPEATVCSMHEQEAVLYMLRERGYRDLHILVPPERAPQMQHGLEKIYGMSATGFKHFYRLLDPAENAELQEFYREQEAVNV